MKNTLQLIATLLIMTALTFSAKAQCSFQTNDLGATLYPTNIISAPNNTSPLLVAGSGNSLNSTPSNKGNYFLLHFAKDCVGKTYKLGNDATCNGTDDGGSYGTSITIETQDGTFITDAINTQAGGTHVTFTVNEAGNYWVLFNDANCGKQNLQTNELKLICSDCTNTPSNDEPNKAEILTLSAPSTPPTMVAGTTIWATSTYMNPWGYTGPMCTSTTCNGGVTAYPKDVWYKLNSLGYSKMNISITAPSQFGTVGLIRVYESSNGYDNFSLHSCECSPSALSPLTTMTVDNLNPNKVYYIAVSPKVGTTGFWSTFSIGIQGDFSSFIAQTNGTNMGNGSNQISWHSTENEDVNGYEIEKATTQDGNYESIGTVQSTLETSELEYTFEDPNVTETISFYRVKMLFTDLTHSYSDVISIAANLDDNSIRLYPNPASDKINLTSNIIAEGGGSIRIYDMKGSKLITQEYDDLQNMGAFDISSLNGGMYVMEIQMYDGTIERKRFTKALTSN